MNYSQGRFLSRSIAPLLVFLAADTGAEAPGTSANQNVSAAGNTVAATHPVIGIETFALKLLITDAGTQPRVALDTETITEYSDVVKSAIKDEREIPFPAVTVFRTPEGQIILADGFHRYFGHKEGKAKEIKCEVREGTIRDAILFSVGANAVHGLRRTQKDKRRAVETLLKDEEWQQWSNVAIAEACGVSEFLVRDLRKPTQQSTSGARKATRGGKTMSVNTGNIGRKGGKAPKASKKASGDGKKAASTGTGETPTPPKNDKRAIEDEKLLEKIRLCIIAEFGENEAKKFIEAYKTGALENMSVADMRILAMTSDARIKKAYPLVSDLGWKPRRAYDFLDRDLSDKSTVGDLINHGVARKGRFEVKLGGFKITVEKAR